jgi:hypothetical protein
LLSIGAIADICRESLVLFVRNLKLSLSYKDKFLCNKSGFAEYDRTVADA